jgi:hypothetical protein
MATHRYGIVALHEALCRPFIRTRKELVDAVEVARSLDPFWFAQVTVHELYLEIDAVVLTLTANNGGWSEVWAPGKEVEYNKRKEPRPHKPPVSAEYLAKIASGEIKF